MLYNNFKGHMISALGFGAMRLPCLPDGSVNEPEALRIIRRAYDGGVNYFDTAFSYHGGASELIVGKALKEMPRDSVFIASKFPGHELRESYDAKAIFERQLQKCGVERFDFYLLHNVYENSVNTYYDPRWGIIEYLLEQKKQGRIGHLGFSSHGQPELLSSFLGRYGEYMEFGQLQLNWLDWNLQDAKTKYEMLTAQNIPVWVMEPVRGGALTRLSDENTAKLKSLRPEDSVAAWSFRWLQGLENVCVTLSGMTDMEQVEDNINTYAVKAPLNAEENLLLEKISTEMSNMLPCTACRYCCASCPQGLDIPMLLRPYNDSRFAPTLTIGMTAEALSEKQLPSACIACGNCSSVCPQGINVPGAMSELSKILEKIPKWSDISRQRAAQPITGDAK